MAVSGPADSHASDGGGGSGQSVSSGRAPLPSASIATGGVEPAGLGRAAAVPVHTPGPGFGAGSGVVDPSRRCVCGCQRPYIWPRSAAHIRAHLDDPVSNAVGPDGSPSRWTTRQVVYGTLEHIERHCTGRAQAEGWLGLIRTCCPGHCFVPQSLYLLRQVSGATDWSEHQFHLCAASDCVGHVFVDEAGYATSSEQDASCPHCNRSRLEKKNVSGGSNTVML